MEHSKHQNEELDLFTRFKNTLARVQDETNLSKKEILEILEKKHDDYLPASVFGNRSLGVLETLVKYLKEELRLPLCKIARLLNRDNRTIWSSYDCARKKEPNRLKSVSSEHVVPLRIFSKRRLGALEALVMYLRDNFHLTYSEIARLHELWRKSTSWC